MAPDNGEVPQFTNPSLESVQTTETALPGGGEVTPTMGQFDKAVTAGAKDFLIVYGRGGMSEAQTKSAQCYARAQLSSDILETDYCSAFDMSAVLTDLVTAEQLGMPYNAYFQRRSKEIDSDYARFEQASGSRTEIIWQQVKSVLFPSDRADSRSAVSPPSTDLRVPTTGEANLLGKKGRCSLNVAGTTYIDGDCWIRLERDGSFQITSLDERYFAQLDRTGTEAVANWNEDPGSTHAHSTLGTMQRDGACWRNEEAQICAWAT
jgi:hypothetical protein